MIGIAEHDLSLHLRNSLSCNSLNRSRCTDRHKDRRLNNSMRSSERASTSVSVSRSCFEREHVMILNVNLYTKSVTRDQ
jgi:hypothetical protein